MGKQRNPMASGGGGAGMLAQLQKLQEEVQRAQKELEEETVTVTSGGGAVTIVMTGGQEVRSVKIAPEALQQGDADLVGDLLAAAVNQAVKASKELARKKLGPLMP
jgi:DNA-binding YbaB/EbfC family protein